MKEIHGNDHKDKGEYHHLEEVIIDPLGDVLKHHHQAGGCHGGMLCLPVIDGPSCVVYHLLPVVVISEVLDRDDDGSGVPDPIIVGIHREALKGFSHGINILVDAILVVRDSILALVLQNLIIKGNV